LWSQEQFTVLEEIFNSDSYWTKKCRHMQFLSPTHPTRRFKIIAASFFHILHPNFDFFWMFGQPPNQFERDPCARDCWIDIQ
jgi:hypothetical protein